VKSRVILDLFTIFHDFSQIFSNVLVVNLSGILLIFTEFFTIFTKINCERVRIGRDIVWGFWREICEKRLEKGVKLWIFGQDLGVFWQVMEIWVEGMEE